MALGPDNRITLDTQGMSGTATDARTAEIDVGLRQYMLQVYNYMASGSGAHGHRRLLRFPCRRRPCRPFSEPG